jgi:hypothetical protein
MSDHATYKKVKLNGEDHILKFGFNAISDLEEYYQRGIHSIITEEVIGFNTVRNILWAGMLWKNPQLKVHHVGQMLEKEIEENEQFDFNEMMKTSIDALYNSKAFKLLSKNVKGDEESKN